MQIVIDIPDAPIKDYRDLFYKIHGMAAREGLFDDKVKSQRALALKVVLDILDGIVNGTPIPKGHGRLIDADVFEKRLMDARSYYIGEKADDFDLRFAAGLKSAAERLVDAPTIIEADTESEG